MISRALCFLLLACAAPSATLPEGGRNVLPADWQPAAKFQGSKTLARAEPADFGPHGKGWRVEVLNDKAGPFQLQLTTPLEGEGKSGDKMLLTFEARCAPGSSESGKGRANAVVEIKEPPSYVKLGQDSFDATAEWTTIYIPFPANASSKAGITHASLMPGGLKQTLEIASMRLLDFGTDFDLAKLPRPYIH